MLSLISSTIIILIFTNVLLNNYYHNDHHPHPDFHFVDIILTSSGRSTFLSTFGYDFKLHPENAPNYFEFDSLQMNPYLPQVSTSSESYVRYDLAIRQALATVMALTPPFEHHCLILISDGQAVNSSRPVWHDLFDYVRNWLR